MLPTDARECSGIQRLREQITERLLLALNDEVSGAESSDEVAASAKFRPPDIAPS